MCTLNRQARDIMMDFKVNSCTDITGFGLIGHAYEMASGGNVSIEIDYNAIPKFEEIYELASMGLLPEGVYKNRHFAQHAVKAEPHIDLAMQDILYDPQTSGGLMIAVDEKDAQKLLSRLKDHIETAAIIGHVVEREESLLNIR